MLYIRADGNEEIGTGHIMRCLSIAAAHRKSNGDCVFLTADTKMKPLLDEQGFRVICIDSTWNDLDKETEKMEVLIRKHGIKKLLVDSYFIARDYLERLHKLTYLIYMDDIDAFIYPCSELINYNIYADKLDYPTRYPNTKLKLGPAYVPLREEFSNLALRQIRKQVKKVLVTTGGSDPFNVAGEIVRHAVEQSNLSGLHYDIVAGRFNMHLSDLHELSKQHPDITIHQNVSEISKLMIDCDIAVSAGGSTLYELCACSVPTIVFSMADNQIPAVSAFSEGCMIGCGDWRNEDQHCLDNIVTGLVKLTEDTFLRQYLSTNCRKLVDGFGAFRILDNLK